MKKIRIGKDIKCKWKVTINDRYINNSDDITLYLITPRLDRLVQEYIIEDGTLIFTYYGKQQQHTGEYTLVLYLNKDNTNQSVIDTTAFTLVRSVADENDNDVDNIECEEINIQGNLTIAGASAYETWLELGNSGTKEDFIKSLKGADGKDGVDGKDADVADITPTTITTGTGINSSLQVGAFNCEANGINSLATGVKAVANGNFSVAMGRHSTALGRGSIALGGLTKSFTFTGAAGATRYSTNLTNTYANALYAGQRCHLSTEGNDEVYYTIQSWEIVDNVYYVTLDRTIDANNDVSITLYLLCNAAVGASSIALGGIAKGTNSAAIGQWNVVNGGASVALGSNNTNSQSYSFSAGYNNISDGSAALAMGHTNKAIGGQAIAIGYGNEATQPVAIAIGNKNTVPKQSAIGIGVLNDSIGSSSVAIGYKNKAHNHGTVTLGGYTTATNQGEVAVGIGNVSHSGTRFTVGGGNELLYYDESTNKNLFEIMSNGDIYCGGLDDGVKLYDGVNKQLTVIPTTITNGSGENSSLQVNALGCDTSGINSFAGGINSNATGNYAIAFGRFNEATGRGSVALGGTTVGFNFTGAAGTTTYTTNINVKYLKGMVGTKVYTTTDQLEEPATITNAVVADNDTVTLTLDKSLNPNSSVSNVKWYLLLNSARGTSAIALGGTAIGNSSVCLGQQNITTKTTSCAIGHSNLADHQYCLAVGYSNVAGNSETDTNAALAIGHTNKAIGKQAIAVGYLNNATNNTAMAFGSTNTANGYYSVAMGGNNTTNARGTVALGFGNVTDGECGVALGYKCHTTNDCEVAVGYQNISHAKVDGDESTATIFSIGSGEGNAIEVMQNGDIYLGTYPNGAKLWDMYSGTSPLVTDIVNNILIEKGLING